MISDMLSKDPNFDLINHIISSVFQIEDITYGSAKQKFMVRYHGRFFNNDTQSAYETLDKQLKPMGITPLFRWDGLRQAVVLIPGVTAPARHRPVINLILFILTLISVLVTGALYGVEEAIPTNLLGWVSMFLQRGWPFAVSLIAILTAHEFGHYFAGRHHGLNVSLPYFIPFPLSPFGTMGAFINMKDIPRNRKVLLDIGIAGPLSGLVVAIPVLLLGLSLSTISTLPEQAAGGLSLQLEGNSILYLLSKFVIFGQLLPSPASYEGLNPLLYWIKYFFSGQPLPLGGVDVMLHPVAWAGWAGLLVTGLNLIPAGQLDGGHILFVLFGEKRARILYPIILITLVALGFFWNGWWLWAVIIFLLGRFYAEPLDMITELDMRRKILGGLAMIVFILTFIPVPLIFV